MATFRVLGETYEYPTIEDLTTAELRSIKEHTKLAGRWLAEAFVSGDADALIGMVYVVKSRAGEKVTWAELDKLRPYSDIEFPDDDSDDEESSEEQSNPPTSTTGGETRTQGSRATSRSSRTTSTSPPDK